VRENVAPLRRARVSEGGAGWAGEKVPSARHGAGGRGSLRRNQIADGVEFGGADAPDVEQIINGLKGTVLLAVGDDGPGRAGADAGQSVQFFGCGGVDVDLAGGRGRFAVPIGENGVPRWR